MPFIEPRDASLRALLTSSVVTDLEDSKTKSTAETFGVGTLIAIPVNLPFISGYTKATAFAAPVEVGTIFVAAALALLRSPMTII